LHSSSQRKENVRETESFVNGASASTTSSSSFVAPAQRPMTTSSTTLAAPKVQVFRDEVCCVLCVVRVGGLSHGLTFCLTFGCILVVRPRQHRNHRRDPFRLPQRRCGKKLDRSPLQIDQRLLRTVNLNS
jgi:hypothetical protein